MITILEALQNAQYNFSTFEKQNPQAKQHPIYAIAKAQLDNALKAIDDDDSVTLSTELKEE